MGISVHTNQAALIALQNLNSTNDKLGISQERISTGLRIANAKDRVSLSCGHRYPNTSGFSLLARVAKYACVHPRP